MASNDCVVSALVLILLGMTFAVVLIHAFMYGIAKWVAFSHTLF